MIAVISKFCSVASDIVTSRPGAGWGKEVAPMALKYGGAPGTLITSQEGNDVLGVCSMRTFAASLASHQP
jgi:hypothetical protein